MNEPETLSQTFSCFANQSCSRFKVFICVNQPDEWWDDPVRKEVCMENLKTLRWLKQQNEFPITLIDRSTRGNGWKGKQHGVGWARKTIMDAISEDANDEDIILSLDADTTFGELYLESVLKNFNNHPEAISLSIPYYHFPVSDEGIYRAILRYEIYLRHYLLNLLRIGSPYAFTALGSALACTVQAYRRIGGLTPKLSGEDFYFLQQLKKNGKLLIWNDLKVYPAARLSDRVYFGTGPALIRGTMGNWSSYPIYSCESFDLIKATTDLFLSFYQKTPDTPVNQFLIKSSREEDPWAPLRKNYKQPCQFIRACHSKLDGLRILQFLKQRQKEHPVSDEESLKNYLFQHFHLRDLAGIVKSLDELSFRHSGVDQLEQIRQFLMKQEDQIRSEVKLL